jgi:hypothetical protein
LDSYGLSRSCRVRPESDAGHMRALPNDIRRALRPYPCFYRISAEPKTILAFAGLTGATFPTSRISDNTSDFDNDGKSDILLQNATSGEVEIWEMHGIKMIGGGPAPLGTPSVNDPFAQPRQRSAKRVATIFS